MSKDPFVVKSLVVHKAPGFPRGMEPQPHFCRNINIIAGANGSGKSTTARMIQKLIWREQTTGLQLDGSILLQDNSWQVSIDSQSVITQRDGIDADFSGIPDVDSQGRYFLALQELIQDDEEQLAREIIRQSIGGFDLEAARHERGYSGKRTNRSAKESQEVLRVQDEVQKVVNQQRLLKEDQERLETLYDSKKAAEQALQKQEFFDRYIDFLDCRTRLEHLAERLGRFPDVMAHFRGGEKNMIDEFEQEAASAKQKIAEANRRMTEAKDRLQALMTSNGVAAGTLEELEKRLQRLTEYERDISKVQQEIQDRKVEEQEALLRIDANIDTTAWEGLQIGDVEALDKLLQESYRVLAEKQALEAEAEMLENKLQEKKETPHAVEKLWEGISILGSWLKESSGPAGLPFWTVAVLTVLGICAAIVSSFSGWMGLAMGAVITGFFVFVILRFLKGDSVDVPGLRKQDYAKTGLAEPASWEVGEVTARLNELSAELSASHAYFERDRQLQDCRKRLSAMQPQIDELRRKQEHCIAALGTAPALPQNIHTDFTSLYWFLKNVQSWQEARLRGRKLKAQEDELSGNKMAELNLCNEIFKRYHFENASDATAAGVQFELLKKEEKIRQEQRNVIENGTAMISEQTERVDRAEAGLAKIYERLRLTPEEKENLEEFERQLQEYRDCCRDHYAAGQAFQNREQKMHAHILFSEFEHQIKDMDLHAAASARERYEAMAATLPELNRRITEIETRVSSAMEGRVLEDLLQEKEQALSGLEERYSENLSSITGNLLIDELRETTRKQNQSLVFKRANQLFNQITNGRYELRVDDREGPVFSAFDTTTNLGQSLAEISTGTRVQLLMAVRIAYVESNESTVALPILADELLANSDEERAGAIIRALIEISRRGRQIFYFTAQGDELNKWQHYLALYPDIESNVVILKGGHAENKPFDIPADFALENVLSRSVPDPLPGETHQAYAARIPVQSFDMLSQDCKELHLGYLIEDTGVLHQCLKGGVTSWGQLESFYAHGGVIHGLDDDKMRQLKSKMDLLQRFQKLYRKGRHTRIDRSVLEKCGAITANFIDEVAQKLEELDGRPEMLLSALEAGQINRFRKGNVAALKTQLTEYGYMSQEEPQSQSDIMAGLAAFASMSNLQHGEAMSFINRVLNLRPALLSDK